MPLADLFDTPPLPAANMSEPKLADPDLEARLQVEGYAIVQLMDENEALATGRRIASLYPPEIQPNQPDSNWYFGLTDPDRELVVQSSGIMWEALVPPLSELFVGGRCQFTSVAIKPAGAGPTPMHQHWPTTANPFARRINCWALLTQSGPGPGSFRLVPRSHQLLPFVRFPEATDYFDSFSARIDQLYAVDIPLRPGQALLFEDSILHGTQGNPTPDMRIAGLANFIGADMDTAIILPRDDESLAIIDTERKDGMADYLTTGHWPEHWRQIGILPNRNRAITEPEFQRLLDLGRKATVDFDPLDLVRGRGEPMDAARKEAAIGAPIGGQDRRAGAGLLSSIRRRLTDWLQ